jgi:hypothetical protein
MFVASHTLASLWLLVLGELCTPVAISGTCCTLHSIYMVLHFSFRVSVYKYIYFIA